MSEQQSEFQIDVGEEHPPQQPGPVDTPPQPPSKLLSYLRLARIPNVFTALADVAMGYLFVHPRVEHGESLAMLLVASGCLYTAGMVLNDVFDFDKDAQERPHRPIPSGAIPLAKARALGFGLLVAGVLVAMAAGLLGEPAISYRSGVVGVALAAAILLYDAVLKETILAPWLMGSCRFLNVLLGMSLAPVVNGSAAAFYYEPHQLAAAGGMGLYIAGVTWFARTEAADSNRSLLGFGITVMIAGLGLLAFIPDLAPADAKFLLPRAAWPFIIMFLMLAPLRRCFVALTKPDPQRVQLAVKQCILSLIVLNAAIVKLTSPLGWALAVCALLIPTLLLGRWVYST